MKELYRHHDYSRVGLIGSVLESEGIRVLIKNRNLTMAGLSEIPIPEFYPVLCVVQEEDETKAKELLHKYLEDERRPLGEDWVCTTCGEAVPDSMGECWQCQSLRAA